MKIRQLDRIKRYRVHSSLQSSITGREIVKLPPVTNRQKNLRLRSLSSYELADFASSRIAYNGQKDNKISSKIDFFNHQNQRKLDMSRKNILKSMGAEPFEPKPKIKRMKRKHNLSPALHSLVSQFLRKKQQDQQRQGQYTVIGSKNKLLYY